MHLILWWKKWKPGLQGLWLVWQRIYRMWNTYSEVTVALRSLEAWSANWFELSAVLGLLKTKFNKIRRTIKYVIFNYFLNNFHNLNTYPICVSKLFSIMLRSFINDLLSIALLKINKNRRKIRYVNSNRFLKLPLPKCLSYMSFKNV